MPRSALVWPQEVRTAPAGIVTETSWPPGRCMMARTEVTTRYNIQRRFLRGRWCRGSVKLSRGPDPETSQFCQPLHDAAHSMTRNDLGAEEPLGGYVDGKGAAAEANSIEIWSENSYRHLGKIL